MFFRLLIQHATMEYVAMGEIGAMESEIVFFMKSCANVSQRSIPLEEDRQFQG